MKTRGALKLCVPGALFLLSAPSLPAGSTTYEWTHAGTGNNLSTSLNWKDSAAPVSSLDLTLLSFALSGPQSVEVDTPFSVNGLSFSALNNSAYTSFQSSNTHTLTLGTGGLTLTNDGKVSFQTHLEVSGNQTWNVGPNSSVEIGSVIKGSALVTKTGTGKISYLSTSDASFTGGFDIQEGTLVMSGTGAGLSAPLTLRSTSNGTVSLVGGVDTAANTSLLSSFLTVVNPASFAGTLSLDSQSAANVSIFSPASLDLSGFTQPSFRIGSTTSAIVTATIGVGINQSYAFGNGGGTLFLNTNLGPNGTNALAINSSEGSTATVVLGGTNTFTGGTTVDNSFLILDSPNALPSGSMIAVSPGGMSSSYVSFTPNSGLGSLNSLIALVNRINDTETVFGVDSSDFHSATPVTLTGFVDMSTAGGNSFIGTRSRVLDIPAATQLRAPEGDGSLQPIGFAAFDGARINLGTSLTANNTNGVIYGLNYQPMATMGSGPGTYSISGHNSYNGGTYIRGGSFELHNSSAFGSAGANIDICSYGLPVSIYPAAGLSLTLSQSIYTNSGSLYLGAAGTQLRLTNPINGYARLIVSDGVTLSGQNYYVGGTELAMGRLSIGGDSPLGDINSDSPSTTGLTMASGTTLGIDGTYATVGVPLRFGGTISFAPDAKLGWGDLNLGGDILINSSTAQITLLPGVVANFGGTLGATGSAGPLTFTFGSGGYAAPGGIAVLGSTGSSALANLKVDGAGLIFTSEAALPTAALTAINNGLVGISGPDTLLTGTLAKITDKSAFAGTLSLDSINQSALTYATVIDQAAFSHASFRIGSSSKAILASAPSLGSGTVYRFGGGGGTLTVSAPLPDNGSATSLLLDSTNGSPLTLQLTGTNGFTGGITVNRSFLVLDAPSALPPGPALILGASGYASYTGNTSFTPATFLTRVTWSDDSAVVGFDNASGNLIEGSLSFSSATATPFIGTRVGLNISDTAVLTPSASEAFKTLRFAAFQNAEIQIRLSLSSTDVSRLVFGHPDATLALAQRYASGGRYILSGNNTYTGGTTINNGTLLLAGSSPLGTGPVSVTSSSQGTAAIGLAQDGALTLFNDISLAAGASLSTGFIEGGDGMPSGAIAYAGLISGPGSLKIKGAASISITGNNSYTGGTAISSADLLIGQSGSLGTGPIALEENGSLHASVGGVSLANAITLFNSAGLSSPGGQAPLSFTGNVSVVPDSSSYANIGIGEYSSILFGPTSTLSSPTGNAVAYFSSNAESPDAAQTRTNVVISGATDASITAIGANNLSLIFTSNASLPSQSLFADCGGTIGVSGPGDIAGNNVLLSAALSRLNASSWMGAAFTLDTLNAGSTNVYGGDGMVIDLTAFSEFSGLSLGSTSRATLAAGTILTPSAHGQNGREFRFGGGGGTLLLANDLHNSGEMPTGLSLSSPDGLPFTLILQGDNSLAGLTTVDGPNTLIFDSPTALSNATSLVLGARAYASYTQDAAYNSATGTGLTPQSYLSRISSDSSTDSIVGFDNRDPGVQSEILVGGTLNLTGSTPFLGTRSQTLVFGSDTEILQSMPGSLKFAAIQGGAMNLLFAINDSVAPYGLVFGYPDSTVAYGSSAKAGTYTLGGSNSYTGPTTINNGDFVFNTPTPFGSSASMLTIMPDAGIVSFSPGPGTHARIPQSISATNSLLLLGGNETDSSLTLTGAIYGSADIQTAGPVTLLGTSTLTGNTYVVDGDLRISGRSPLGTGRVTVNSGRSLLLTAPQNAFMSPESTELSSMTLRTNATLGLDGIINKGAFNLSGDLSLHSLNAGEAFVTHLDSGLKVSIGGPVSAPKTLASWTIDKGASTGLRGGTLTLNSSIASSIPAIHANGVSLVLNNGVFTSNLLPASLTSLSVTNGGLLSVTGANEIDVAEANNSRLASVLSKITTPADFAGTLSLDSNSSCAGQRSYGGAGTTIDLSAFTSAFTLGSNSTALIPEGTSLLFSGDYRFGGGKGSLVVAADLSGAKALQVGSDQGGAQMLTLSGTNTFTGDVTVRNAILLLSGPNALAAANKINLQSGGFVSSSMGLSAIANFNGLLARLDDSFSSEGILGVELGCMMDPQLGLSIDLSALPRSLYLGSTSMSRFGSALSLTAPLLDPTLRFTSIRGGGLIIDTQLKDKDQTHPIKLVYGHPNASLVQSPYGEGAGSYTITGNNTYSGGTTIYNGSFSLTNSNAFGSGALTIEATNAPVQLYAGYLSTPTNLVFGNGIQIADGASLLLGNGSSSDVTLTFGGPISGPGKLVAASGIFLSGVNTFTGGTRIQSGSLGLSGTQPLGSGDVYLDSGASLFVTQAGATLSNSVFMAGPNLLLTDDKASIASSVLRFDGTVSSQGASLELLLHPGLRALFTSGLSSVVPDSIWTFTKPAEEAQGGLAVIGGTTSANISTLIVQNAGVIFTSLGALPDTLTFGNNSNGLLGVMGDGANNNALLDAVLARFDDKSTYSGTLSLDSTASGSTLIYGGSDYTLDLQAFTNSGFALGSASKAVIAAGTTISLPPSDGHYSFGGGPGSLVLQNSLNVTTGLVLKSPDGMPLTLTLQASNSITSVDVQNSFLIVAAPGALPGSAAMVNLGLNGYASYTPDAGFATPADFLARINPSAILTLNNSILGWDALDPFTEGVNLAAGTSIDLGNFGSAVYLGTRSRFLTLPSDATLKASSSAGGILKFAALKGASIDLSAPLLTANNVNSVVYGHPNMGMTFDAGSGSLGSYTIRSASNNYTGGTTIFNGSFFLGSNNAFGSGTGTVTIDASAKDVLISPTSGSSITVANDIAAANSLLRLGSQTSDASSLTFNGTISGPATLSLSGSVTLAGANTYDGGTIIDPSFASIITLANNSALGTGGLKLGPNALLVFGGSAPVLNDFSSFGGQIFVQNSSVLTINQSTTGKILSPILGGSPGAVADTSAQVQLVLAAGVKTDIAINGDSRYTGGTLLKGQGTGQEIVNVQHTSKPFGTGAINLDGVVLQVNNPTANLVNPISFSAASFNTLAGSGAFTVTGGVTIGSNTSVMGGVRDVGSVTERYTPGTLAFNNNVIFSDGGTLNLLIQDPFGTAGLGYGSLLINGNLDFSTTSLGGFTVNPMLLLGSGQQGTPLWATSDQTFTFVLAQATSISNFNNAKLNFLTPEATPLATWSFGLNNTNTQLLLNFSPVPEPETWAMMLGGSATLLLPLLKRRRNSRKGVRKQETADRN